MKYLCCILFAWLMVGCLPASTTSGPALVHPNFPYAVTYDDQDQRSVMGNDWNLETHRVKKTTTQDATASTKIDLERKDGFDVTYEFDFNDDDRTDARARLQEVDLVLNNRYNSARLEVITTLLDSRVADKKPRLLLDEMVLNDRGTHALFSGFGREADGKRYASKLLDVQEATLGGHKGLVATIDRIEAGQLAANSQAPWRRTRLLLLPAPFAYYVAEKKPAASSPSGSSATSLTNTPTTSAAPEQAEYHPYRVLLLVEYSASSEDFEAQYPQFLRLLGKLHILNDERLLAYLASQLGPCSKEHLKESKLTLDISPLGEPSVANSTGFDSMCLSSSVGGYRFTATGEKHQVSGTFDFTQTPPAPDWLTKSEYSEERPAAAAPTDAAPAAPSDGATPPADGATPPAEATPAATPQPAGGESSPPSPSSANSPESGSSSKP